MDPDRVEKPKNEPRTEEHDPRERTVAPPIEREHETQEGVVEENAPGKRDPAKSS